MWHGIMSVKMPLVKLNPDSTGLNSKEDLFSQIARGPGKGKLQDQLNQFPAISSRTRFLLTFYLIIPSVRFVLSYLPSWSQGGCHHSKPHDKHDNVQGKKSDCFSLRSHFKTEVIFLRNSPRHFLSCPIGQSKAKCGKRVKSP